MKFTHLVIVGCGGTGSFLVEALSRLLAYHDNGTKKVVLIDGDKFEEKNLQRQLFDPALVGKNKAEAIAPRLKGMCEVKTVNKYVDREAFLIEMMNIDGFCDGNPLVVLSVDNHATRKAVIAALDEMPIKNFFCMLPGNELDYGRTGVYCKMGGQAFGAHPFEKYPDIKDPTDRIPGGCAKQAPSTPQLISANFGAAYVTLLTIQALLDGEAWFDEVHFNCRKFKMLPQGNAIQEAKPDAPAAKEVAAPKKKEKVKV
jgi:hypothetical protein